MVKTKSPAGAPNDPLKMVRGANLVPDAHLSANVHAAHQWFNYRYSLKEDVLATRLIASTFFMKDPNEFELAFSKACLYFNSIRDMTKKHVIL